MPTDTELLEFIANCERVTTSGKCLVQVISKGGHFYSEYFAKPPHGEPYIIHKDRLTAMRVALAKAYEDNG